MTLKFRTAAKSEGLANMKSRLVACKLEGAMQVGWWVGWPSVGNSAKIREAIFPKKFRNRRNIGGFCVEVPRNEDGALRVHTHFCDDGSNDGVGFGSLKGKLGTVCEPVNDIA